MMRHFLGAFRGLALATAVWTATAGTALAQTVADDVLVIATWGGFYQKAQTQVLAEPFSLQSGRPVSVVTYTGQPNEVRRRVASYRQTGEPLGWDVLDLERADAEELCFNGYLEPLDLEKHGIEGVESDFVQGAIGLCWVGNVVWSRGFGFDRRLYTNAEPYALADAFDPLLFPGRRLLTTSAQTVMELALLSAGVAPELVYDRLQTAEGLQEAVSVLDQVRANVRFFKSTSDVFRMLKSGQGAVGLIHHFDALRQTRTAGPVIGYLWDGHVIDLDVFAIPAGASNPGLAMDFIANVSRGAYQSAMATVTGYGPARLSAAEAAREDLRAWLPTASDHLPFGLLFQPDFWDSPDGAAAQAAYDTWRRSITGTL